MVNHWLTLIISTSPSTTDPSIEAITTTITKMREYKGLEQVPVIVMCDGAYSTLCYESQVELESKTDASEERLRERTERYEEYKKRLIPWCDANDVKVMVFPEHTHRAGMTREALKFVTTPCVLTLDHDTYVIGDVPWDKIQRVMGNPEVNSLRFYQFEQVHPSHAHLMGPVEEIDGVPMMRTIQYGDGPNIQRTEFLQGVIEKYIGKKAKIFVEEIMWPTCHNAGWEGQKDLFKLWIYAPPVMANRVHIGIRGNLPMAIPFVEYPC